MAGDHLNGWADCFKVLQENEGVDFPTAKKICGEFVGLNGQPSPRRILRRFKWEDAEGRVAWHLRWEPGKPKFTWAQDEHGKQSGLGPCNPTLRDLDGVGIASWIIVCAGERDQEAVNTLLREAGLFPDTFATTTPHGESDVKPRYLEPLFNKPVVFLSGDNDGTGQAHIQKCEKALQGTVHDLRVLRVPDGWNDWSDWQAQGATAEEFKALLDQAPPALKEEFGADRRADEPMEEHKPLSLALLDYPSLLSLKLPEQKRHLAFLPEGGSAMVFGLRGVGKTFLKLALTASLTTGQDFLGWKVTEPCGVLYIDGEMQLQELKSRITALLPEPPTASLRFLTSEYVYRTLQRDLVLTSEEVRSEITAILDAHPDIRVVIFDNISCLFSGIDEDRKRDWEPIAAWLIRLRHRGLTTVLGHHAGKTGEQRGTSGREDALDTVIQLKWPPGYEQKEGCHFELHFTKCRSTMGEDVASLDVRLAEQNGCLAWTWKTLEASKEDQARTLFQDGVTSPIELADELGISKGYASKLLRKVKAAY